MEGKSLGREDYNLRAFGIQCGNIVQWNLLGIYEDVSTEDS